MQGTAHHCLESLLNVVLRLTRAELRSRWASSDVESLNIAVLRTIYAAASAVAEGTGAAAAAAARTAAFATNWSAFIGAAHHGVEAGTAPSKRWDSHNQHHCRHHQRYRQHQKHAPQRAARHRLLLSHHYFLLFSINGFALHPEPGSKRDVAHWQKDQFLVGQCAYYYYLGLVPRWRLEGNLIHPTSERNCPKSLGHVWSVALRTAEKGLSWILRQGHLVRSAGYPTHLRISAPS